MPATYEPIATTTLSSAASSIAFTSISGSYTDLRLVLTPKRATTGEFYAKIRFNSDTGTNYSITSLYGDGSSALSGRQSSDSAAGIQYGKASNGTNPSLVTVDIFSYSGTSTNKTFLANSSTDNNGDGGAEMIVGLWRSTSAITRIDIVNNLGTNFAIGTTATLYGILKA